MESPASVCYRSKEKLEVEVDGDVQHLIVVVEVEVVIGFVFVAEVGVGWASDQKMYLRAWLVSLATEPACADTSARKNQTNGHSVVARRWQNPFES